MSTQPQASLSFTPLRHSQHQYQNQPQQLSSSSTHRQPAAADVSASSAPAPHISPFTPHQHHGSFAAEHLLSSSLGTSSVGLAHMARLQAHFAQLAPSCSAHLADQNAIPILSTTPHPGSPALSTLSAAFVQAHDTASRMGLGVPLRVTLSTGSGAAVIQTGTLPECDSDGEDDIGRDGFGRHMGGHLGGEHMMLVGTVVAPADRLADARIASWGVEDVARKFQKYMHEGK